MNAGIDFGTTNCSIGLLEDNQPNLQPLEGDNILLPSALYITKELISIDKIDAIELKRRIIGARSQQSAEIAKAKSQGRTIRVFNDDQLESRERAIMRREGAAHSQDKYEGQTITDSLNAGTDVFYGEEAIRNHIQFPQDGFFIKSPKTFLGAEITNSQVNLFGEIVSKILLYIKNKTEIQQTGDIENIVLGRPVNFHGTRGREGNKQALDILEKSSRAVGFKNIEFLMEPIAASLDYERSLLKNQVVLVIDIGGGTTDCSMVELGPSYKGNMDRQSSILGFAGERIGGMDLDKSLATRTIMPSFGRNSLQDTGLPIPYSIFDKALSINDVNSQRQFLSDVSRREIELYKTRAIDEYKINRLLTLQQGQFSYRLNRSAELAKIYLSDQDSIKLPLYYIEPDFFIPITRGDLKMSIGRQLDVFISLMKEVENQAGKKPDVIYVTGGTAKSPVVVECIRTYFGDIEIVVGDLFGSVTSGLTTWADTIYR